MGRRPPTAVGARILIVFGLSRGVICMIIVNFIRQVNWQQTRKRINAINTKKKEKKKTNNV